MCFKFKLSVRFNFVYSGCLKTDKIHSAFVHCQMFSKLVNNSNKKTFVDCQTITNSFYGKIKFLAFFIFSYFLTFYHKPSLDFHKRSKTKISKIGPAVLEFQRVKILKAILPSTILATFRVHLNLLHLITQTILGERYKL